MIPDWPVARWETMRRRHPMFNEPYGKDIWEMWERGSGKYSPAPYSEIITKTVDLLRDKGYIDGSKSLIDIGSGPGTFALPLSETCGSVLCVDSSPGMLRRVDSLGRDNVTTLLADCLSLPEGCVHDISFSSLCPPMNCPEGLAVMESAARERCVYLSSINPCPGLEGEIWSALGREYSYRGYDTVYPARYLGHMGRRYELHRFTQRNASSVPAEEMEAVMLRKIAAYRPVGERERTAVHTVIESHTEDGMVPRGGIFRMGVLIWEPVSR